MKNPPNIPGRSNGSPKGGPGVRNKGSTGVPRSRRIRPDGTPRRVTPEDHARIVALLCSGVDVENVARQTGFNRTTIRKVCDVGLPKFGLRPARDLVIETARKAEAKVTDRLARMIAKTDETLDAILDLRRLKVSAAQNTMRTHRAALATGAPLSKEILAALARADALLAQVEVQIATATRARLALFGAEQPAGPGVANPGDAARARWGHMSEEEQRAAVADGLRGMGLRVVDDGDTGADDGAADGGDA